MSAFLPVVAEIASEDVGDAEATAHAQDVGARLRVLRHQLGWSLADVEAESNQEITASDLGDYEAGEQAVSFFVFRRLVRLYGVSSDSFRSEPKNRRPGWVEGIEGGDGDAVSLPIEASASRRVTLHGPVASPLRAYCVVEASSSEDHVPVGTAVIVKTRYLGSWTEGFEVAELLDDGYRLRRLSDNSVLLGCFAFEDVRCLSPDH
jgi:transcriptional regulator with XRE-family HTH domain